MELELTNQIRHHRWTLPWKPVASGSRRVHCGADGAWLASASLHVARVDRTVEENNLLAVELFTRRTKQATGLIGLTMQQLRPHEQGQYGYVIPVVRYQSELVGFAHQVAMTISEELR
ncbi:hypothetical protein FHR59_002152 [Xanthomonas arboricola]|uniref:hypothetical protein n=1 Tax=Xanthomonas arboricola TaxID=56448 RepID=UPI001618CE8C|nr:hypothetical protein [Xanthomonas arboricola]MBB6337942.1 hypothetical protein [Xanthomonas arboricola]